MNPTRTTRSGKILLGLLALLIATSFALVAPAGADLSELDRAHWVDRWNGLNAKQQELSSALTHARAEYRRGRRPNRLRGEERVELLERIATLEQSLEVIETDLAAFPEIARRAGALPGWFREP